MKTWYQQIRNFAASEGDRIDAIAQALRRLFLRTDLCPCMWPRDDAPITAAFLATDQTRCVQCRLDHEVIAEAWAASEPSNETKENG